MKCTSCGFENADGSKFCKNCGKKLESAVKKRFCRFCGNEVAQGTLFCTKCGKSLQDSPQKQGNAGKKTAPQKTEMPIYRL